MSGSEQDMVVFAVAFVALVVALLATVAGPRT